MTPKTGPPAGAPEDAPKAACGGLAVRRMGWRLTWRGRLAVGAVAIAVFVVMAQSVHPFLSVTERVPSDTLVVEGWISPNIIHQVAAEYKTGGYRRLILVRPILDVLDKYQSGKFNGDYVAYLLIEAGVPKEDEIALFPLAVRKDRTFHAALAVKQWFQEQGLPLKSIDLASVGPHSRRSRLLYEKAFGDGVPVGIIAMDNPEYNPRHWWRTSEGVRDVVGEAIAYGYARFLFRPTGDN